MVNFVVSPVIDLVIGKSPEEAFWVYWFAILISYFLYYFAFESMLQKTPGKFFTGTRVVMEDGSRPSKATIAKRTLWRFIPNEGLAEFIRSVLGKKGTCRHDRRSGTLVIPG
jgi:uncharacterized RDD family membrane protein YckC